MYMQNKTIIDLLEIMSYTSTTIHTFAALFEKKFQKTISGEECKNKFEKRKYQSSNISGKFYYGKDFFFINLKISFTKQNSTYKV